MKRPLLFALLLLQLLALMLQRAAPTTAASDVQITFETNPPLDQVRPFGGPSTEVVPVQVILSVRDAQGALVPNAQLDFKMIAPQPNLFISTDVPRVEGVTLLDAHFVTATGQQTFTYIMPIRGAYQLTISASPTVAGAFNPTTKTLDWTVNEKEASLLNAGVFLLALFAFGAYSGYLLTRSHLAARAAGSVNQVSGSGSTLLLVVLGVIIAGWIAFLVFAEVADAAATDEALTSAQLSDTASASSGNAKFEFTVQSPSALTPSQPASFIGKLTDANGAPILNAQYEMSVAIVEDGESETVFATTTDSVNGTFNWTYAFWDGIEHTVKIVASPATGSATQFAPVTFEHQVPVVALAPPMRAKVLGTLYLMLVVGAGVFVGVFIARQRKYAGD